MTTRNSIWALLSSDPDGGVVHNNLLVFWLHRPNIKTMAKAMNVKLPAIEDIAIPIIKIFEGEVQEYRGQIYVLREVRTNSILDEQGLWG